MIDMDELTQWIKELGADRVEITDYMGNLTITAWKRVGDTVYHLQLVRAAIKMVTAVRPELVIPHLFTEFKQQWDRGLEEAQKGD